MDFRSMAMPPSMASHSAFWKVLRRTMVVVLIKAQALLIPHMTPKLSSCSYCFSFRPQLVCCFLVFG